MSAVMKPSRSDDAESFLAWEAWQTERYERVDGEVYLMTGARLTHNTIVLNAAFWLRQAFRGTPCRVFSVAVKLRASPAGDFLYPDVLVTCDPRDRNPAEDRFVSHPWLVVEVLSESTAAYDRGRKFELYRGIATLTHYLLVETDRAHADLFFRSDTGLWVLQPLAPGDQITIERLGQPWPLATLYEDVDFAPPTPPAPPSAPN